MSKTLLAAGTYPAKTNAKMVVYEADSGSLCAAVPLNALSPDGEIIWSGKTTITLGKSDGTLMTKAIENLKKCFPEWGGQDPFVLEEIEPGANDLSIVGEHETYTPKPTDEDPDPQPVETFKVKWLNPPGGSGAAMKEPLDEAGRKKVLTKWGGKFKAGGSAPAAKAAPAKAAPTAPAKPAPKGAPTPPSRKPAAKTETRSSSQEEVWTLLKKANEDETDEALAEKFYAAQDEVVPGANGEMTAEQWGEVAEKLGV